ncbi:MAG TPA: septum formation initiator family protein [Solirubrobacteraceae bacterium]|jgi:cell division protein FtsL
MAADPLVAPPRPRVPQRPRLRPAPPPRRVSGPAAPARTGRPGTGTRTRTGRAVPAPAPTPVHRALELVRHLPDSKLLDRLLRGQGWVVLIGVALMGVVALQVSLLKLNAGIGQSIEKSAQLERQNADLRAEVSRLSSEGRIAKVAGEIGLIMPNAGQVRYVNVRGERDAQRAAEVMRAPDPVDELGTVAPAASATTDDPAASTTTTDTTTPASGTTATAPPATTTPPAQTAPTAPTTPTQSTPSSGTAAGATAAPAGTTATPGQ